MNLPPITPELESLGLTRHSLVVVWVAERIQSLLDAGLVKGGRRKVNKESAIGPIVMEHLVSIEYTPEFPIVIQVIEALGGAKTPKDAEAMADLILSGAGLSLKEIKPNA